MSTEDRHRAALKDFRVKRDKPRVLNNHSIVLKQFRVRAGKRTGKEERYSRQKGPTK